MGRTVPTFRQLIDETFERWSKFRRALRREDQEVFDHLSVRVRCYTQAGTYQCSENPMETILLTVALDQEKRLRHLESLLQQTETSHATRRLDFRPVSLPAGDGAVDPDEESEVAPSD